MRLGSLNCSLEEYLKSVPSYLVGDKQLTILDFYLDLEYLFFLSQRLSKMNVDRSKIGINKYSFVRLQSMQNIWFID